MQIFIDTKQYIYYSRANIFIFIIQILFILSSYVSFISSQYGKDSSPSKMRKYIFPLNPLGSPTEAL